MEGALPAACHRAPGPSPETGTETGIGPGGLAAAPSELLPAPASPRDAETPQERVTALGWQSRERGMELGGPSSIILGLFF